MSTAFRFTHAGTCDKILNRGRSKLLCSRLVRSIRNLSTSGRLLDEHKCVAVEEAESFNERCMRAVGTPKEHCRALSQVLVAGMREDTLAVRNIPKFKNRANWSRDTFQPMRRRACVYQQTIQNIAPVIKYFQNSGRRFLPLPDLSRKIEGGSVRRVTIFPN